MGPRKYIVSRTSTGKVWYHCKWHSPPSSPCNYSSGNKSNFKKHYRGHTGYKPFVCPYPDCKQRYATTTKGYLDKHIRRVHLKIRDHECTHCGQKFHKPDDLRRHIEEKHQEDRPYKCELPGCKAKQAFKSLRGLRQHQNRCSGKKPHACTWDGCGDTFCTLEERKNHINRIHLKLKPFECKWKGCNLKFCLKGELTVHMRYHTQDRRHRCKWEGCGAAFVTKGNLNSHMKYHTNQRDFPCTWKNCNHSCFTKQSLNIHLMQHAGIKLHKCNFEGCDREFVTRSNLVQHMASHFPDKPFECSWEGCGNRFKTKGQCSHHEKSVHGTKNHKCTWEGCTYSSTTKRHLNDHVKGCHLGQKEFVCTWEGCEEAFVTSSQRSMHMLTHTNIKSHTCPWTGCTSSFSRKSYLDNHMRIHEDKREFRCDQCEKAYNWRYALTVHKRSHDGSRPYECLECKKRFITSTTLAKHLWRHEENQNWTFICPYAELSTHMTGPEDFPCERRFKHQRALEAHIDLCHTPGGIQKKIQTEEQLATFLKANEIEFTRDYENTINLQECPQLKLPGKSCRPDFFLPELSADLGAIVLIGNDEYAHRYYPSQCEFTRMLKISSSLFENPSNPSKLVYIRFNPHFYTVDETIFDPSLETRYQQLLKLFNQLTFFACEGLSVIYMYYDEVDGELNIFNDENLSVEGQIIERCSNIFRQ